MTLEELKTRAPWNVDTPKSLNIAPTKDANERTVSRLFSKISIKDKIAPESIAGWLYNCTTATSIDGLDHLDTSLCTDMGYAFYNVSKVQKLDLHHFDTSNVERIDGFIYSSEGLEEIDVSGFNLNKVKSISNFIRGGRGPESGTGKYYFAKINKVNISGIKVDEVRSIFSFITYTCNMESLDITDFNPHNACTLTSLFQYNTGLKRMKFGKFEVGKKAYLAATTPGGYIYELNHDDYYVDKKNNNLTTFNFRRLQARVRGNMGC